MASATCFVHTSRFEGFPNVLLEALAEGCPVVAIDCPSGPAEILDNGACGVLLKERNPAALARALASLLADAERQAELSSRGRERILRFAKERIVAEFVRAIGCDGFAGIES